MIEDGHNKAPRRTTLYSGISGLPRPWIPYGMNSGAWRSRAISTAQVLRPKGRMRLTAFLAVQRDIVIRRTSCNLQGTLDLQHITKSLGRDETNLRSRPLDYEVGNECGAVQEM